MPMEMEKSLITIFTKVLVQKFTLARPFISGKIYLSLTNKKSVSNSSVGMTLAEMEIIVFFIIKCTTKMC